MLKRNSSHRYNTGDVIKFQLDTSALDYAELRVGNLREYPQIDENAPYLNQYIYREYLIDKDFRTTWQYAKGKPDFKGNFKPSRVAVYKRQRGTNNYPLDRDIDALSREYSEAGLIYLGTNSLTRKKVVVDIDKAWPYKEIRKDLFNEQAQDFCNYVRSVLGIVPSHVILNTEVKECGYPEYHFQLHFDLSDYFLVKNWKNNKFLLGLNLKEGTVEDRLGYEDVTKVFNLALDGDVKFTGAWSKNPYCNNGKLWTYHTNTQYKVKQLKDIAESIKYLIKDVEEQKEKPKKQKKEKTRPIEKIDYGLANDSRNVYAFVNGRAECFRLMRQRDLAGESTLITLQEVEGIIIRLQRESPAARSKGCIESRSNIHNTAKGLFRWLTSHYKRLEISKYSETSRVYAAEAKQVDKAINILIYRTFKGKGLKKKEIAKLMGVSQNSITTYDRSNIQEATDKLREYYNKHKYSRVKTVIERITKIFELLNYYNVTLFEEKKDSINDNIENLREVVEKISNQYIDKDYKIHKLIEYFRKRSLLISQDIRAWPKLGVG